MNTALVTVFLVDDDPFMLHFMSGTLRSAGHRVEAFERPEALLERLSDVARGCVVVDLRMPGLNGLELQQELATRGVTLPLIFVSGSADVPAAVTAMKGGAVDFLSKPVEPSDFCAIVARALEKDADIANARASRMSIRSRWIALTPRERDVCRLAAKGHLDKQIGAELGTAVSTVQAQRIRAFQRLGVTSVVDLVQLLARAGNMD